MMRDPKPFGLNELREMFLKFFETKEHLRLPSFSLIPQNDASLLLINSGMAPMKPWFTGEQEPPRRRVCTCQKCIRTGDIENIGKTAFESGKNRLGFRIAETDIELKHLRTVFRNHDSCVDNAAVVKFFLPDAFQKTLKHFFINLFHQRIRDDRGRGVSAHSARIGPLVIVQETFVILRRNQRNYRFAIGQRENRRFLADQKFFDDDDTSRCPERSAEALLDRILRVFPAGGDNDAFSGGESIRFDNDAAPCVIFFADIFQSAFLVSKTGISGGRNAVFDHELLGEILAALQPGGIF